MNQSRNISLARMSEIVYNPEVHLPIGGFGEMFEIKYKLGKHLSSGGFGEVYRGENRISNVSVVLKRVPHQTVSSDKLPREIAVLKKLAGVEGMAHMIDHFLYANSYIIVMENAGDVYDLDICIRYMSFLERGVAHIMKQLINTLLACHEKGIVHCDIKPENILMNVQTSKIILIDFGCARQLCSEEHTSYCGTSKYAPPEWFLSKRYKLLPAECWAIGIITYELLCFDSPFWHIEEVMYMHVPFNIRTLSIYCMEFIRGCLTKAPANRMKMCDMLSHRFLNK